ncbi:hypothetical protein FQ087_12800 [Sporosarcina sp. ANT_H38]|uniref:hypothetical protein n=1 Tax=Sporosarcina sp. ANT_H38 TaxID=2597358 RepID=UPI0011F1A14C|nr:hypothetical protein [Sporosarcina sp. ANT_H38]KAA0955485.1 hypothetical protein FQ087_12800 [Sporosarcina sp. ANT_H38]
MNKFLKVTLIVVGVIILGIAILVFSFLQSMKPDKEKEEKVKIQAEEYLEEKLNDNFEIYGILHGSLEHYNFEYGAKVRDKKNKITFYVYYNEGKDKMVDTYTANKWADDLENEIRPYIKGNFGETTDFDVFYDDTIGEELDINSANPGSYRDFSVAPIIRFNFPRKKREEDEKLFNEFISYLKSEDKLQQGTVIVGYVAENGVWLEDDEWSKEF